MICKNSITYLTVEQPVCEVTMRAQPTKGSPSDCPTRSIKSDMEIWHPINQNQWLFVITKRTTESITSQPSNAHIIDVDLKGIFSLKPNCKCYTFSTLLVATSKQSSNYSKFIPEININQEYCCIRKSDFLRSEEMESLKLNNLNLMNYVMPNTN
ncbi:hypothetical protein JTB14_035607 [Gonioctena quinquepunctata]|nr:hypothetical protein JTB14_035607 [Gonioctena quinquepunctata]